MISFPLCHHPSHLPSFPSFLFPRTHWLYSLNLRPSLRKSLRDFTPVYSIKSIQLSLAAFTLTYQTEINIFQKHYDIGMKSPHKNVDFSDGQKNPFWIHITFTAIPLMSSHHIAFSPAWLNTHYHKLINTSVVAPRRPFIYKLTIFYIFSKSIRHFIASGHTFDYAKVR